MKTKRFAALFLTLAMLLGISPLSVFAGGSGGDDGGASPQISLISAFVEPDVMEIAIGDTRTEVEIMDSFPDAVSATVNGTAGESVPVTEWSLVYASTADGAFSASAQAEFYYEPTLAAGYTLSGEAILPSQKVQVGEALSHGPQLASAEINPTLNVSDSGVLLKVHNDGNLQYSINGTIWTTYTGSITITSTTTTTNVVQVQSGEHSITLNGVDIQSSATDFCAFEIAGNATANITLADGSTNTLRSNVGSAGLQVQSGATLSIGGTGSLSATGGSGGAGIGGGENGDGGNITISGGTVTATGNQAAGIGGGENGDGGNITISGGTVTATGNDGGAGIGGGDGSNTSNTGNGGTIDISGGTVTATGNDGGAGIGGGSGNTSDNTGGNGGSITISGSAEIIEAKGESGGAGIGGGLFGDGGIIRIEGGTIRLAQSTRNGAGIGGGGAGNGGSITISGSAKIIKAQGGTNGAGIGGGDGANAAGEGGNGGNITISGFAEIIEAQGGTYGAGIGGGLFGDGGIIQIEGGTVTALGGLEGAGIGGGGLGTNDLTRYSGYNAGFVTISGGTVTATGGDSQTTRERGGAGAGIGGGARGGNGGTVKILGGMVTATGGSSNGATSYPGSDGGAGIGGGGMGTAAEKEIESAGGIIIISGGTVVATGGTSKVGSGGAGIGNGAGYMGGGTSTFSTSDTNAGNAFVVATGGAGEAGSAEAKAISNDGNTSDWSGVIFKGNDGLVYGAPTLATNATIQSGQTLTIENSRTLTVNAGTTLTNEGTLTNDGTLTGTSTLVGTGTFQTNVLKAEYITGVNASYTYTGSAILVNPAISNPTIMGKEFTVNVNGWNYVIEKQSGGSWAASEVQDYGHYRVRYYKAGATEVIKPFTVGTFDTLSFDKNGGSGTAEDMSIARGTAIGTLPTPTKEGYTFNGWTIDGQPITNATVWNYAADKTAVANWTINRYTVSFEANGGSAVSTQTTDYNTAITKPQDPTKSGYTLEGWYTDSTLQTVYSFATPVTANITLYAKWTENSSSSSSTDFPYNPSGTVNTGSSTLPTGTRLEGTGTPVSADTLNKMKQAAVDAGLTGEIIYIADLTLVNTADGTAAQPNANTRIRIDVPGITSQDKAWVLHEKADGSIEKYDAVCFDGYVEFAPTSFSVYSVVVDWASRGTSGTTTVLSPQTGVYA